MTETIPTASARWIDTADVAKLVRKHLKKEFPGVKFSVRSSRYAGGSSIDVRWTDGPTANAVDKVTAPFSGSKFDGMIDLQYGARTWYCPEHGARTGETYGHGMGDDGPAQSRCCHRAELVKMGADYVHTQRGMSDELRTELEERVARETGRPYAANGWDDRAQCWGSQLLYRLFVDESR
jgi:hypothetical protein